MIVIISVGAGMVKVIPNKYNNWKQNAFYFRDDINLNIFKPNSLYSWRKDCFGITSIHINSHGFRDVDWDLNAQYKIAILGDSYMEGFQVSDGDYTAAIMRTLLNLHIKSKIEVFNTGLSGNGTVHELYRYRKYLKTFKPDIVLLFFLVGNDFRDNSCELSVAINKNKIEMPCAYVEANVVTYETNVDILNRKYFDKHNSVYRNYQNLKDNIKYKYPTIAAIAKDLKDTLSYKAKVGATVEEDGISSDKYIYDPPIKQQWLEAWQITEETLIKLNQEIIADGGKLIIVINAENPYSTIRYPEIRLMDIANKDNISILSLTTDFIAYKDMFALKQPYFSFYCDGHWNPLGHFIAANVVVKYIIDHDYLPIDNAEKQIILAQIVNNLNINPKEILGTGYDQIYKNSYFKGKTNIKNTLKANLVS
ncbi:MAG: SGNH/GDSL hydrolase family protein [Nitrospirota bacterium]